MVGGGPESMIGSVHRRAAFLDHHYSLEAGVFSRNYEKTETLGKSLGIAEGRLYHDYMQMFENESQLPQEKRIQVVSIVTPNDSHFSIAKQALKHGFNVILDKPITQSLAEAVELQKFAMTCQQKILVTYVFSAYPMIREARYLLASGKLGKVRKVMVEFSQGWLATFKEAELQKQATWRMDPASTASGTITDIGTHAFHLAEFVTGFKINAVCANLTKCFTQRKLEDDGVVLVKFDDVDAHGVIIASQSATGDEADLNLRIYAEKGSLHWQHTDSNTLTLKWENQPAEVLKAGYNNHYLSKEAKALSRTAAGHPEGYIEAFANLYRLFAEDLFGTCVKPDYPTLEEGLRGMRYIETVMQSHQSHEKWTHVVTAQPMAVNA